MREDFGCGDYGSPSRGAGRKGNVSATSQVLGLISIPNDVDITELGFTFTYVVGYNFYRAARIVRFIQYSPALVKDAYLPCLRDRKSVV